MKLLLSLGLMLLVVGTVFSQGDIQGNQLFLGSSAQLFKTYTTFTATSDDTTGYLSLQIDPVLKTQILLASEVRLLGVGTDSVAADVYVIGRNKTLTGITATYADSIVGTSNTSNTKVINLRTPDTDLLDGCTEIKVGTVFRATGQGTTAGRTLKWYLLWRR